MNHLQVGQWGEHIAAAWFIRQGWNVYSPRSANNANIDFVVEKDGELYSIQVKASSSFNKGGGTTPLPVVYLGRNGIPVKSGFDYLFAVHTSGKARLYPASDCPKFTVGFPAGINKSKPHPYDIELF